MSLIYGIDVTKEITPKIAVEALTNCFFEAHCKQTDLAPELGENSEVNKNYCVEIIKKAFFETGGDIENPTKDSVIKTLPWLAEFSKKFRDQEIIEKHMTQITKIIQLIK
jgi:hypothetical protein